MEGIRRDACDACMNACRYEGLLNGNKQHTLGVMTFPNQDRCVTTAQHPLPLVYDPPHSCRRLAHRRCNVFATPNARAVPAACTSSLRHGTAAHAAHD
jgi:hypothetical protein